MSTKAEPVAVQGAVRHIFISPGHNFFGHHGQEPGQYPIREVDHVQCRAGRGLMGDRFFDYKENHKGQVTFFEWEVYQDLCRQFDVHDRPPSAFRRNVVLEGVDVRSLIGHAFVVQGVLFEGAEESRPCDWMNHAFAPGAEEALQGRGGLRARILTDGTLRPGPCQAQDAADT